MHGRDVVVVGFQEIVNLSASSVIMGSNSNHIKQWIDLVLNNLNKTLEKVMHNKSAKDVKQNA